MPEPLAQLLAGLEAVGDSLESVAIQLCVRAVRKLLKG